MKLRELDYYLPPELIAQHPLEDRAASRMLVLDRATGAVRDDYFRHLPAVLTGRELIVLNDTKVFPARLFARRRGVVAQRPGRRNPARKTFLTAAIEVLLTRQLDENLWEALVRPGRKVGKGEVLIFGDGLEGEVVGRGEFGVRQIRFHAAGDFFSVVEKLGHVPLPPYIKRPDTPADRERYQTVFARRPGAVAAPTAGLHFTPQILDDLKTRGAEIAAITLDVGLGTFQPIHTENLEDHHMQAERYEIGEEAACAIRRARAEGRPVVAVGTTVVRALEHVAAREGEVLAGRGQAELFLLPGHAFRAVDQLLTNFHLPRSSLLALVCAFAGREKILAAYEHAVRERYRFYSYGDCMLIR